MQGNLTQDAQNILISVFTSFQQIFAGFATFSTSSPILVFSTVSESKLTVEDMAIPLKFTS